MPTFHYGKKSEIPRILFIGNNPNNGENDFGTLFSVNEVFGNDFSVINYKEFFNTYYNGTIIKQQHKFYGIKNFKLFKNPTWSISRILNDVFSIDPSKKEDFSYTNSVLCKGKGEAGAPSNKLRNNCVKEMQWLRKTLEVIEPNIIFIFSIALTKKSAWTEFTIKNGVVDEKIDLKPESANAYKVKYKIHDKNTVKEHISLVFGIPHLTSPRFNTWTNPQKQPIMFRELFRNIKSSDLTPDSIVRRITDNVSEIIKRARY